MPAGKKIAFRCGGTDDVDEHVGGIKGNVLSSTDLSSLSQLLPENAPPVQASLGDANHHITSSETQMHTTHFEFDEQTLRSLQQFMESQGLHTQVCAPGWIGCNGSLWRAAALKVNRSLLWRKAWLNIISLRGPRRNLKQRRKGKPGRHKSVMKTGSARKNGANKMQTEVLTPHIFHLSFPLLYPLHSTPNNISSRLSIELF